MESHEKHLFLFFDHNSKLALFFSHVFSHIIPLGSSFSFFQLLGLCLELFDSQDIALNFMLNNPHGCITNLIRAQKLMELGKVGIRLEDIQQVKSQVNGFFEIVSQCARHCAKQSLVVKHYFHVFMGKTKVEE